MKKYLIIGISLFQIHFCSTAQTILPIQSQYFNNPFLVNPAMAGFQENININAILGYSMSGLPGAPMNFNLTADAPVLRNLAAGVHVNSFQHGVFTENKMKMAVAYLLPFKEQIASHHLRFGLALGMGQNTINRSKIVVENSSDVLASSYYAITDIGASYVYKNLTLQAVFPNFLYFKNENNRATSNLNLYYFSGGYTFSPKISGFMFETIAVARKNRDMLWIADVGIQTYLQQDDKELAFSYLYHTDKSSSLGLSYLHPDGVRLSFIATVFHGKMDNLLGATFEGGINYTIPL